MIHLSKVTKLSAGKTALRDATLLLPKGSLGVLKVDTEATGSMLLRLIMGYERPDRGTVIVNGVNVTELTSARIPFLRRNIGWVEFTPNLAANRTVLENLAMPLQITGFNRKAMRERIADKLEQANIANLANVLVQQLDESTQRQLACARATIHNPQTILADCPETATHSEQRESIYNMLESANDGGTTVLMVTTGTPPPLQFTHSLQTWKGSLIQDEYTASRSI